MYDITNSGHFELRALIQGLLIISRNCERISKITEHLHSIFFAQELDKRCFGQGGSVARVIGFRATREKENRLEFRRHALETHGLVRITCAVAP